MSAYLDISNNILKYFTIQTFRIVPFAPDTTMVINFMLFLMKVMEYELGVPSNIITFPDASWKSDQLLLFSNLKIYIETMIYNNCFLPLKNKDVSQL